MSQATLSGGYYNSNLFSGTYLDNSIQSLEAWDCDTEARVTFETLQQIWEKEGGTVASYKEDQLRDYWIQPVLEALGFETLPETALPDAGGFIDRLLLGSDDDRREAAKDQGQGDLDAMYDRGLGVLEAKQWDADFEANFSEYRQYRNASHQIKYYLEKTPSNIQWGVLTDGKKWRLYGTKDYETQTYYEVDLPELLERGSLEDFKRFYVFFRADAFRERGGTTFLEQVWSESETAAQELGEDLQDQVFTALRVLGRGLLESNDLDIDPSDDESREELKEQSLVLLYRLMFILYAESRGLIHPDSDHARRQYEENFSLETLRDEIFDDVEIGERFDEEYSEYSTTMWSRLEDLFGLIDEGNDDLGIPPYNGGLFDAEEHTFLAENEVNDRYLAEVIYRVSTTENDDGETVRADYGDLDTRHLGSIYEGLLEHQFNIAPEQMAAVTEDGGQTWKPATEVSVADAVETVEAGDLYVVNDDGERKATGAYYTPDYVVTYIVEETVDPLLEGIREDIEAEGLERGTADFVAEFAPRVQDLKILDPAMGSGHFLTKATGYLTEQIMAEAREAEVGTLFDESRIRREIAKECIYGVDLNEMAVELAKLSMWLETLAADQPLAFLDHHLKAGNSLVGSDIEEIEGLESDTNGDSSQSSLAEFGATREGTIERLMEIYGEFLAIENEDLDDVKEMERKYAQIQEDDLRRRLVAMANVRTAEDFGLDVSTEGDRNPYEWMASALESDDEWATVEERDWFRSAQALAEEHDFFHWKLEFPEVFYENDGSERERGGYDTVVGNPPYVRQEQLGQAKPYLSSRYRTYHSAADLYTYFIERGSELLRKNGAFGNIISNKFSRAEYGEGLRELLAQEVELEQIIDFGDLPVFSDASAYPMILIFQNGTPAEGSLPRVAKIESLAFDSLPLLLSEEMYQATPEAVSADGWSLAPKDVVEVLSSASDGCISLETYIDDSFYYGIKTGLNDAFFISDEQTADILDSGGNQEELIQPLAVGDDVRRYFVQETGKHLITIPDGWTENQSGLTGEDEAWEWFNKNYPSLAEHLSDYEQAAKSRYDRGQFWWELRACDYYDKLEENKIVYPVIAKRPRFAMDSESHYINDKCFTIPIEDYSLLGVLNSNLAYFWVRAKLSGLRGGYQEFRTVHLKSLPLPKGLDEEGQIAEYATAVIDATKEKEALNLHLPDYLTSYSDGPTLADISSPPSGLSQTLLTQSEDDADRYEKLRIGSVEVNRDSDNLTLSVVPYVKPVEAVRDEYETNSYGYTTLDPIPAMEFRGLDTGMADLIESFVPYAVDEAGGFAGFRENATATITPLDRLESLTLPALDDVRDGLADYRDAVAEAEELDEKIQRTDDLIDEIVYDLYGLTDEEIEIVEEAVGD